MTAVEHEYTDDEWIEYLDEIYPEVNVCGYYYSSGYLLKLIDPIAFDIGKSDAMRWECSECGKVYDEEDNAENCCPEDDDEDLEDEED